MSDSFDLSYLPPASLSAKDLDQYFGVWAIETNIARGVMESLHSHALTGVQAASREYDVEKTPNGNKIAHVIVRGVMTKRGSSLSEAGSTVAARRAVLQASHDDKVDGIMLHIESPGGAVSGVAELGDAIYEARNRKPVLAHIEDIGASAAYWIASQATSVYANRAAEVGSIGVFMVVADQSRLAENAGVRVHVIRAGEFKGAGTPGTPITEQHLAEFQRRVDVTYDHFVEAIARGRGGMGIGTIRELADGRVHPAPVAANLGLIDGVMTEDEAFIKLENLIMSQHTDSDTTSRAATLPQLRSALIGAPSETLLECLSNGMTLEDAKDHWILMQSEALTALNESLVAQQMHAEAINAQLAGLTAEIETLRKRHSGVSPIGNAVADPTSGLTAKDALTAEIDKECQLGYSRTLAAGRVARRAPELFTRCREEAAVGS